MGLVKETLMPSYRAYAKALEDTDLILKRPSTKYLHGKNSL